MIDHTAAGHAELLNAAAESLVLVDITDPECIAELVGCIEAIGDLFGADVDPDHASCRCVAAARSLSDRGDAALIELVAAFDDVRVLVEALTAHDAAAADGDAPTEEPAEPAPATPASAPAAAAAHQPAASASVSAKPAPASAMPLSADEDLVRDFAVRAIEHLDEADQRLLEMESQPTGPDGVDAVFRAFHTIKGMAGFLAFDAISEAAHAAESMLAGARAEKTSPDADTIQSLFAAVDGLRALVVAAAPGVVTADGGRARAEEIDAASVPAAGTQATAQTAPPAAAPARPSARETSVRVDERRLDALLDAIGELVISESMVSAGVRMGDVDGLDGRLEQLDKITRELQQMATTLRMVPMRATFRRMARLVRDLAHKAGKPVELVLNGEDIELDKTVVDRIQDPLVHALRNAVDHGIESAEERIASGKPATARIVVSAYHSGGSIHIDVADDGRGMSLDAIRDRAIKNGLIAADETPTDRELLAFVYAPGFSTAEKITDVSGRGVGMDVVKRTVEELRGHLNLTSVPGKGTTLSVRLPVTLAIIDGMVCRIGAERFIVPVLAIERSVRPLPEHVDTVTGRGLVLSTGDGLVPIVSLHELLGVPDAEKDPTKGVIVIVDEGGRRVGLLVCELLGQQQTVIKPLGDGLDEQLGLAGGAIMSDGRVGLILDAPGLVRLAHEGSRRA